MIMYLKRGETLSWSVQDTAWDISGVPIEAAISRVRGSHYEQPRLRNLSEGRYVLSADDTADFRLAL